MPKTEFYPVPELSYTKYGHARTQVETRIFLRDLKAHAGEWLIYTEATSFHHACEIARGMRTHDQRNWYKKYHENIEIEAAYLPGDKALVLVRWVPAGSK